MAVTKGDIAIQVFDTLGMSDGLTEPTPGEYAYSMKVTEQMIAMWERKGLHLGYIYSDPEFGVDTNDDSGLKDTDVLAVVNNTAVRVAPKFGRSASQDIKSQAHEGYRLLFDTIPPVRAQNPSMPAGQGNNYCYPGRYSAYMPTEEQITVPDDGQLGDLTT